VTPRLDGTLAALADPTRRAVVDLLRRGPRRAGDIAAVLEQSAPAMSRHLRVLRRHGLVIEAGVEGDARVRIYRLQPQPFRDLQAWLDRVHAHWSDQLDAFKSHAERAGKRRRS
jgi:DNA-binding transcriptional ArsR family regulator